MFLSFSHPQRPPQLRNPFMGNTLKPFPRVSVESEQNIIDAHGLSWPPRLRWVNEDHDGLTTVHRVRWQKHASSLQLRHHGWRSAAPARLDGGVQTQLWGR